MTLTDIHSNPALLAEWLGITPEGSEFQYAWQYGRNYVAGRPETHDEFMDRLIEAWRDYLCKIRPKTTDLWINFVRECLREEFGIKVKSPIADIPAVRQQLIKKYPLIYSAKS
jgi:hypothetical protein